MDWDHIRVGFFDELDKIAEISLHGLSPQTVLEQSEPPPPMETPGFAKAKAILDRAQSIKTAARRKPVDFAEPPQLSRLSNPVKPGMTPGEKAISLGGHVAGGMGLGKLVTEYGHGLKNMKASPRAASLAMTAGGALGAARFAQKRLQERRMAKMSAVTPGLALKASQQVGKIKNTIHGGKGITSQIRGSLIGRKFVP